MRVASGLAVVAVALAACASNNKIDITDEEYDDLAISLGTTARLDDGGGELPSLANAITLARGGVVRTAVVRADDPNSFDSTLGGCQYEYTLVCSAEDGTPQARCDATSASAEVYFNWTGPLPVPYDASVTSRIGRWVLTGLRGPVVTVTGEAGIGYSTAYANRTRGVLASYEIRTGAIYTGLEYAITNDVVAAWPTAGLVTYDIVAKSKRKRENVTNTRTIKLPAVLAFNADALDHADLTLDDDPDDDPDLGPRRIYDLELPSGSLVRTGGNEGGR